MAAQHYKEIAQRIVNAENSFIACMEEDYALTESQALAVFNLYKKEKILKIDSGIGSWTVKHGAFLDKSTIQNAVKMTQEQVA
tara:strand:+ start:352 stop:600 length:249 start_codon:yes stop_codon:yes gene_type:complete